MAETMTPLQRNSECRRIAGELRAVLNLAATHRDERQFTVNGPDGPELGWIAYERYQIRAVVDAERAARDLPPARLDAIVRVERLATGHSDYVAKFAWGCAELVVYPDRNLKG